ncbi:Sarcoplasmic calcium-binding, partial [Brachionus plicatilis]
FDAIDSDKSGSLNKEKYTKFFKALNVNDEALANKVFESIDSKGAGSVSKEEFAEFGKNFFTCAENEPASLLFGPLVN